MAALPGKTVRGFPDPDEFNAGDLVALALPGEFTVEVTDDGYVIHALSDQLVEAGMLKQRLLSVAVAHGLTCTVHLATS